MAEALFTTGYDNVVVIDTQVVLEAKPLEQLPWGDLFAGTVLLLVSRQVQSEIDAKKNDGRLGRRARAFNKLLDEFIETRVPASILATPRIDVALLANRRIDWDSLDDLDRDDGDDRIVAQALNAIVDEPSRLIVLSHDMRPRDGALTHGLRAVKLPESWLREPEPSPEQRRITELEGKVRLLSADQPQITVNIETVSSKPWQFRAVAEATPEQTQAILDGLLTRVPRASSHNPYDFGGTLFDSSHSDRLDTWRKRMRENIPRIHQGLTRLFAQQRIRVSIENVGPVSAEGLSLEIRSGNAVLHSMPYWVLLSGPVAPQPRYFSDHLLNFSHNGFMPRQREQFTFYRDEGGPGDHVIASCASFRQEKTYNLELSVELLARSVPRAQIEAVVTASNMKGDARSQLIVPVERIENRLDDVYDPARRALQIRPPFNLPDKPDVNNFTWYCNDGSEFKAS